jgi:hypothetical protein
MGLARDIKTQGLCDGMDAMEVYARLDRAKKRLLLSLSITSWKR